MKILFSLRHIGSDKAASSKPGGIYFNTSWDYNPGGVCVNYYFVGVLLAIYAILLALWYKEQH